MAQMSKMSKDDFEDYFFNVCNVDYSKMSKAMDGYITYNTETTYNGNSFNNIRFEFENGKQ